MDYESSGSGLPLVLLPGLGCDRRMWAAVECSLVSGFTVLHPHVWNAPSLPEAAHGVVDVLDERGLESVGVAGLSMGGYVAFELLDGWEDRVRAVAFLDTTAFPDTPERAEKRRQVLRLIQSGGFEAVLSAFVESVLPPRHAAGPPGRLVEAMGRHLGPDVFARCVRAILDRRDYTDTLRRLRIPTLFLAGAEDTLTPPEVAFRMAAHVRGAEVAVVPGSGHMTAVENPEGVVQALKPFFQAAL